MVPREAATCDLSEENESCENEANYNLLPLCEEKISPPVIILECRFRFNR